ncbi:hypothetical protein [Paenibacillus humicola]|nr:hypothetical protein [Paenibacillus humicola]
MDTYYRALESLVQAAPLSDEDWSLLLERTRIKRISKGTCIIRAVS